MPSDPAKGSVFPGALELAKLTAPGLGPGWTDLPSRAELQLALRVPHLAQRHTADRQYLLAESELVTYLIHPMLDFRLLMQTSVCSGETLEEMGTQALALSEGTVFQTEGVARAKALRQSESSEGRAVGKDEFRGLRRPACERRGCSSRRGGGAEEGCGWTWALTGSLMLGQSVGGGQEPQGQGTEGLQRGSDGLCPAGQQVKEDKD